MIAMDVTQALRAVSYPEPFLCLGYKLHYERVIAYGYKDFSET
jgi:hypothetical protein